MSAVGTLERGALNAAAPAGEAKARLVWVGVIVAFLVGQVVLCAVAAVLATGDPSFAVVPGYHDRALRWDETVAEQRASEALGWAVEVAPDTTADVIGRREVTITLRDAASRPVENAAVRATLYHHARAGEPHSVAFRPTEQAGVYAAVAEMRRPGLWQFRVEATRADERFAVERTIDVPPAQAGTVGG